MRRFRDDGIVDTVGDRPPNAHSASGSALRKLFASFVQRPKSVHPAVLIVEDDPPLLNLLQTLLRRTGKAEIVTCHDGEEAIATMTEHTFDVVLLDLMMPKKNGFEVIEFLRENRPEQLPVVLVMSAADSLGNLLDPAAIHGVITKPFDNTELVNLVEHIIDTEARAI